MPRFRRRSHIPAHSSNSPTFPTQLFAAPIGLQNLCRAEISRVHINLRSQQLTNPEVSSWVPLRAGERQTASCVQRVGYPSKPLGWAFCVQGPEYGTTKPPPARSASAVQRTQHSRLPQARRPLVVCSAHVRLLVAKYMATNQATTASLLKA